MDSFELFLLLMLCASFVVGPLVGYRAGTVDTRRKVRIAEAAGYRSGRSAERIEIERHVDNITREMPVVSVTVNGDEVDLAPKRAADVRLSE